MHRAYPHRIGRWLILATLGLVLPAWAGAQDLKLTRKVVMDQQGFQMEAFRLLIPQGWQFEGGVSWNFAQSPPAAQTAFAVKSPDGRAAMTQFPAMNFSWSPDPNLQYSYQQAGTEIIQPMDAAQFAARIFIPRYRADAADLEILETLPLPELARHVHEISRHELGVFHQISPFQFPFETAADAAKVKVAYQRGGKPVTEEITAIVHYFTAQFGSMYGGFVPSTSWTASVVSFTSPSAAMERNVRLFRIMFDSYQPNPAWQLATVRLTATITREKIRQQQAVFNRMQQIRQTQQEIGDMIVDSYNQRNAAMDRIFDNYSQAIRGVDTYRDPVNQWEVEIPTGYDNAWTDGTSYVFSEDPGFNPNAGSNRNWERMTRRE